MQSKLHSALEETSEKWETNTWNIFLDLKIWTDFSSLECGAFLLVASTSSKHLKFTLKRMFHFKSSSTCMFIVHPKRSRKDNNDCPNYKSTAVFSLFQLPEATTLLTVAGWNSNFLSAFSGRRRTPENQTSSTHQNNGFTSQFYQYQFLNYWKGKPDQTEYCIELTSQLSQIVTFFMVKLLFVSRFAMKNLSNWEELIATNMTLNNIKVMTNV